MDKVEVAYATPKKQLILSVPFQTGLTVERAIEASGILQRFSEINLGTNAVGVFSKPCKLDTELRAGDRVEIYRPLIADPKEVRRQRAEAGKATKKGAGSASG
ncbi:MAG: RnfH family protein [Cycloclasticus sp.]|jgi:putative ubiquitin-RnfH superfamily antitoxin RatB of RatAB toxin-antitoxin module|nr:RnfH family protein [Cycloclasticus sp.]|tara:strand:- start:147271 stop:147579 length:309 start_codon:yes stop_codon:yes gene_type:complete